MGRFNPER